MTSAVADPRLTGRLLLFLSVSFDELDANLVGPFDKRVFDLSSGYRLDLVGHGYAILAHFFESLCQVVDAEPNVIDHPSFSRRHCGLAFPVFRVRFSRIGG